MATFLLRSGRLCPIKYHQLESWGILRNQSVALLCTQPGEPAKPGKKTKAASKTEASDERANLVAYKTTLGFPVKFSQLEVFPSQSLEAAASAPAEPEESFDNSTYKNYQHHSYTPFTFVDLEVEMAKFRLPQPSSGRPSPRH
ncbi:uncharacterized protein ndufv3 isoform X3 [Channa argus]|uniref:uncharacterized protein ndufv3 isoform X3 n=1 Tax=Channa argus TaxID=215402 RepID=UPI003522A044